MLQWQKLYQQFLSQYKVYAIILCMIWLKCDNNIEILA
jgi:hypothetical protein